jgi:hypothetical protein
MDRKPRRQLPFFPIAVGLAVVFLGLLLLILDRVKDPEEQRRAIQTLVGVFIFGLAVFSWVSVQWRRGKREYRSGRFAETATERSISDTYFAGSAFADTSTSRRPKRIKLDRKERKAWVEVGGALGLELDRSRNPRLAGTVRGIAVRVDPTAQTATKPAYGRRCRSA